jgi:hypothetical protein
MLVSSDVPARLWLGLSRLWLSRELGRAKAATHGLAQAAAFGTHSRQILASVGAAEGVVGGEGGVAWQKGTQTEHWHVV